MKKIVLALSLAVISFGALMAQKTEQAVSDKVKVTFSAAPTKKVLPNGGSMYELKDASGTSFMAMSLDLTAMGVTGDMITAMGDAFFDQMKMGMASQMGGAELAKDEKVTFKGKTASYLEIDGKNSTSEELKGKKAFMYIFFIGAQMHQVGFRSGKPGATKDDAKEFFDSVKVTE